jgi:uncharacterized protein
MKRKASAAGNASPKDGNVFEGLATESYINLATFRRNGKAVETPVWFAALNGKLYVVTDGTSAKVKRLRATQRVRLAPCNVWGGVTGDWVEGTGRIVAEHRLIGRAHAALKRKYGWQMWLLDTTSRLFGRIGRRAYLELSPPTVAPHHHSHTIGPAAGSRVAGD